MRKPGKSDYGVPKAYHPIALLNTIGKLLAAIVTEDIVYMDEKHHLLLANHFGERPGRTTTDSMHLVVNKIKDAWRHHKVMVMLFLDIEGAFPNAATDCLLHNLWKRQILEEYVLFITRMLKDHHTKLKFDDYKSDWVNIDNGIGQGDPLSMILYLFYNADLLDVVTSKSQTAVAYVDDANLYVEGKTYEEAYKSLGDMLLKQGGARDWTHLHNSRFEKSKFAVVCFSRRRVPDPLCHGKTIPEPRPAFIYEGVHIEPQYSHKFLGVHFDQDYDGAYRWRIQ